ncbi:unnamed protein product, partial [Prorocentrum cordatum]
EDREIARLRERLRAGSSQESSGSSPAASAHDDDDDEDQARLAEIAGLPKQLGDCADPAITKARQGLHGERDGIKAKIVRSEQHAGQLHHYTARIGALEKQRVHQQQLPDKYRAQQKGLEANIGKVEKCLSDLAADIQEMDTQRWQVSAKASAASPGAFSLKATVPALDLPIDKLGEMLKSRGADDTVSGSVTACFTALRELKPRKQEDNVKAHVETECPRPADSPSQQQRPVAQQESHDYLAHMDSDDIDDLRDFVKEAMGTSAPSGNEQVREAVKRFAAAAEQLAKRRRTGTDTPEKTNGSGVSVTGANSIITTNFSSFGVLKDAITNPACGQAIALAEELHAGQGMLTDLQHSCALMGFRASWAAAPETGR